MALGGKLNFGLLSTSLKMDCPLSQLSRYVKKSTDSCMYQEQSLTLQVESKFSTLHYERDTETRTSIYYHSVP